jgi:hypothetical protein
MSRSDTSSEWMDEGQRTGSERDLKESGLQGPNCHVCGVYRLRLCGCAVTNSKYSGKGKGGCGAIDISF